jgi:RNA polymerase-binding transcription factor
MRSDGDPAPGDQAPGDPAPGDLPAGTAAAIRDALAAERQQTLDRMAAVSREFDGIVAASEGVATDDEHDPEGATIAFERAQLAALADQAREHLAELDEALDRLRQGRYGRCERCGQPIAAGRLAARPAARTCIACAAAG